MEAPPIIPPHCPPPTHCWQTAWTEQKLLLLLSIYQHTYLFSQLPWLKKMCPTAWNPANIPVEAEQMSCCPSAWTMAVLLLYLLRLGQVEMSSLRLMPIPHLEPSISSSLSWSPCWQDILRISETIKILPGGVQGQCQLRWPSWSLRSQANKHDPKGEKQLGASLRTTSL